MLARFVRLVGTGTYMLSAVAMVMMGLSIIADTVSRSVGTGSIKVVFDLNETLIVVVAFLPLAYAQLAGDHVAFTVIYERLSSRLQNASRLIGYLISVPLIGWMTWASISAAIASWNVNERRMGVANMPVWPARGFLALGLVLFLCTLIYGIVSIVKDWEEFPLGDVTEGEPDSRLGAGHNH